MKNISLQKYISQRTMPKMLALLLACCVFVGLISFFVIQRAVQSQHYENIALFESSEMRFIKGLEQQVSNLSKNDLIINSLIDYENRDSYLPVFFRTLSFTQADNSAIVFTDFSGEVITAKNIEFFDAVSDSNDWKAKVLEDGKAHRAYSEQGLLIASPVNYGDLPEGAIVTVLSDFKEAFDQNQFSAWSVEIKAVVNGFGEAQIVSLQPMITAYQQVNWVLVFALMLLFFVFLGNSLSVKLAATLASRLLTDFQKSLTKASQNSENTRSSTAQYPLEFQTLNVQYQQLLENLSTTTLSNDKFQSVLNSLNEILLVVDSNEHLILENEASEKFAHSLELSMAHDLKNIIPDKYLNMFFEDERLVQCYQVFDETLKGHKEKYIAWTRSDFLQLDGSYSGSVFIGTDVTQARQLEEQLNIKNIAVDEAETSIVIMEINNDRNTLSYVNSAFEALTGYQKSEVMGKNYQFLFGDDSDSQALSRIMAAVDNRQTISEMILNYRKNGSTFINEMTLSPIVNSEGIVSHYLGMFLDVTDREMTGQYLMDAKIKAEESAQLKSEFLASMSHEIRTPMNGVLGMIGLLLKSPLNKEQQHYGTLARTSAESLLTIINDILDFSKVESGKLECEAVEFNLVEQFSELIEVSAQRINMMDVDLVLDISNITHEKVVGDSGRIRQIINNLISNAIKFTEKGEILVSARLETLKDGQLKLICQVKDSGIGIPADRLDKVFESFTQVDASTTRKYGGTGLGLTISKQLCELMGGGIRVSSQKGEGCEFEFDVRLEQAEHFSALPSVDLKGKNVLIVDLNLVSQQVLSKQLQQWEGNIQCVHNSHDAMVQLDRLDIDLVLIDTRIACGQAGFLEKLRALQDKKSLKLILMNTIATAYQAQYEAALLVDAAFSKPCTPKDLYQGVCTALEDNPMHGSFDQVLSAGIRNQQNVEALSGKRVLLVEDNIINQTLALALLDEFGVVCEVANDGREALNQLNMADTPFQLILLDCQMPVMDGYQTSAEIRLGNGGQSAKMLPIIAMTANAMKGDREKCLQAGMDDYLTKPIDVDVLKEKLEHWLVGDMASTEAQIPVINMKMWESQTQAYQEEGIHHLKVSGTKLIGQLKQALDQHDLIHAGAHIEQLTALCAKVYGMRFSHQLNDFWVLYQKEVTEINMEGWPDLMKEFHILMGVLKPYEQK